MGEFVGEAKGILVDPDNHKDQVCPILPTHLPSLRRNPRPYLLV